MLTNPTLNQMQALGLNGMVTAWRELAEQDSAAELGRDEWLGLMLDREIALVRPEIVLEEGVRAGAERSLRRMMELG